MGLLEFSQIAIQAGQPSQNGEELREISNRLGELQGALVGPLDLCRVAFDGQQRPGQAGL
jgi:hypothetical protein